jgi:hypothetical protein
MRAGVVEPRDSPGAFAGSPTVVDWLSGCEPGSSRVRARAVLGSTLPGIGGRPLSSEAHLPAPLVISIRLATGEYERWLGRQVPLLKADLRRKHERMRADPFSLLRATFYRWVQWHDELLTDLHQMPEVLAIGDLHLENFGTWRDAEGRLVWGINDFDEAATLPFTNDLVRLATSGALARAMRRLRLRVRDICEAVLLGYRDGLESGGESFVLDDKHGWLRRTAMNDLRDPVRFWRKLRGRATEPARVPHAVRAALMALLPPGTEALRIVHRVAGLGSLGRPRFLALGRWRHGWIAREARPLAASAVQWARALPGRSPAYQVLLTRSIRTPDPFVRVEGRWLLRRLAPDCARIELESLPKRYDEYRLLHAMGWETANIHLASRRPAALLASLKRLGSDWLPHAVERMAAALREDWEAWRSA